MVTELGQNVLVYIMVYSNFIQQIFIFEFPLRKPVKSLLQIVLFGPN